MSGLEYAKDVALLKDRRSERMEYVQRQIQRHFVGPDFYRRTPSVSGTGFGNAWWRIPLPPTLVIRYDKLRQLEEYIHQTKMSLSKKKGASAWRTCTRR